MVTTWTELFPDLGEPVCGSACDYSAVALEARTVADAVAGCDSAFSTTPSPVLLRGASADALADVFASARTALGDLPRVIEGLEAIFARHAERLEALRTAAAAALARAELRAAALANAEQAVANTRGALATIERQLAYARATAMAAADVHALEIRRHTAHGRYVIAQATRTDARADVDASRIEHEGLVTDEWELCRSTIQALGHLELGDLRDPTGLMNAVKGLAGTAWEWTGGAVVDIVDGLADAAVAFADGRFTDALHHLSDAIDGAIRLTTAIAIAVVIVGSTVCPGALVVLPALLTAGQALSYAEVGATGALALTQSPHPETGEVVGVMDVLVAGVGAVIGRGTKQVKIGQRVTNSPRMQWVALRQAGGNPQAKRTFVHETAESAAALVNASAAGARSVFDPALGRMVTGDLRRRAVRRARLEVNAWAVRTSMKTSIDDLIVSPVVEAASERLSERLVNGTRNVVEFQLRTLEDAWRFGPRMRPGAAGYHVVPAC